MKRYEVVFIDADETLFDFKRAEAHALAQSFARFGLEPSQAALLAYEEINKGLWAALERGETDQASLKVERFRLLFERLGANVDAAIFSAAYIEWLSKGTFLLEGAEEACRYLAGKYELAIITNGIAEVQRPRIGNSAIAGLVKAVIISEEARCGKPSAGIFEYACDAIDRRDKDGMIMVGDSLSSDILGGLNFGIDTCWANLASAANETGIRPTYEIRRLAELKDIL